MSQNSKRSPFRQGIIAALVFFPVLAPFSLLFGVFASDLELSLLQTMGFSFGIFAGASQFASLSLLHEGAPILIALLAGFTLNLRFFLYSATLAPAFSVLPFSRRVWISYLLVDQSFVLSETKFSEMPQWGALEKSQYFFGIMLAIAPPWHFFTILGFYTGALIPPSINIAYALPLSFIALIMPALKTPAHWLAAIVSILGSLCLRGLPYNMGLLISALIAIFLAGQFEAWQKRSKHD